MILPMKEVTLTQTEHDREPKAQQGAGPISDLRFWVGFSFKMESSRKAHINSTGNTWRPTENSGFKDPSCVFQMFLSSWEAPNWMQKSYFRVCTCVIQKSRQKQSMFESQRTNQALASVMVIIRFWMGCDIKLDSKRNANV